MPTVNSASSILVSPKPIVSKSRVERREVPDFYRRNLLVMDRIHDGDWGLAGLFGAELPPE